jgi:hypothetical protein
MLKLLITAISWLVFSGGLTGLSAWVAAPGTTSEAPAVAADAYCKRGEWPDRERACAVDSRPALLSSKPQPAATADDFDRLAARVAAPLATLGSVRFYDASREANEPVAAPAPAAAYALSGTTTTVPMPAPANRSVRIFEPETTPETTTAVLDERLPEAAAPVVKSERRAAVYRPAHTRSRETRRRFANNADLRHPPVMRIYGVAF